MGFVTITKDQARHAHASHYTKPFEVVVMQRSGQWDFPPFSWVYGISDFGSWSGLISTDGEKIVVTRSTYTDMAQTKETAVSNLKCNTREFNERLRSGGDLPRPGPRFVVESSSPVSGVAWC